MSPVLLLILLSQFASSEMVLSSCNSKVNRHVIVSANKSPLVDDPNQTTVALGAMEAILIEIIAGHLNFTYQVRAPVDIMSSGNRLRNGSWTGSTGQLERKEVEWCVSSSSPTLDKRLVTDNSIPVTFIDTGVLIPFPKEVGKIVALFDALELYAWLGIVATFSYMILACWIIQNVTNKTSDNTQNSLIFWILHFISIWTGQGITLRNKSSHFRLAAGVSFVGIYLLSNYYTGAFTSLLSVPNFKPSVKSVEDLANSKTMRTLVIKGSSMDEYFLSSKDPTLKKIGDQLRKYPQRRVTNALTVKDISSLVYDGYSLIIGKESGESLIERSYRLNGKCKVTMAEKTFYSRPQSYSFVKNSNLTCIIDYEILVLQQHGFMEYASEASQTGRHPCSLENVKATDGSAASVSMSVDHLTGAFLVLGVGCALAAASFVVEVIVLKGRFNTVLENVTGGRSVGAE